MVNLVVNVEVIQIWFQNLVSGFRIVISEKTEEFQMLAAVHHKGDHGEYCHTLKEKVGSM